MRHDGPSSLTDSIGAPLAASDTSGTIRPRHPNAASSQPAKSAATARSAAAIDSPENVVAISRTAGRSKKCASAARHRVSLAQRMSVSTVCSKSGGVRAQSGHGSSASRTTRSASDATPSSPSGRPPRHQTIVGRLESRTPAIALLTYSGRRPPMVITSGRSAGRVAPSPSTAIRTRCSAPRIFAAAQDFGDVAQAVRRTDGNHRGRTGATRRLNRYSVLHRRPSFAMSASASGGPHSPAS